MLDREGGLRVPLLAPLWSCDAADCELGWEPPPPGGRMTRQPSTDHQLVTRPGFPVSLWGLPMIAGPRWALPGSKSRKSGQTQLHFPAATVRVVACRMRDCQAFSSPKNETRNLTAKRLPRNRTLIRPASSFIRFRARHCSPEGPTIPYSAALFPPRLAVQLRTPCWEPYYAPSL